MLKKKILFVVPSLERGGAERVVSILSNYLSSQYIVKIVILGVNDPVYDVKAECIKLNIKVNNNVFLKLLVLLKRVILLRRALHQNEPDTIISFMESANIPSIVASLLLGKSESLVISVRNNPSIFPWFYKIAIKFLYMIPKSVVAPSIGIAKDLEAMILTKRKIDFIPNPIELDYVDKMLYQNENLSFQLPKNYILAVGSLSYQKGFDKLIHIFSKINIDNLHLIIIGDGDLRGDLTDLIKLHKLDKYVIMPGEIKNPFYFYKNALCLGMTSRYEGWPNVLNEAIASGCPVVSYNCNYGPSEIINQDNGFLIDEDDEFSFIEAVESIYSSKKVREKIISNGLKTVKKYSVDKIAKKWAIL